MKKCSCYIFNISLVAFVFKGLFCFNLQEIILHRLLQDIAHHKQ